MRKKTVDQQRGNTMKKPTQTQPINKELMAEQPTEFTASDWWSIFKRLFAMIEEHNVSMLSAAVAFYAMLAIFPALASIVTLYALIADPTDVIRHLNLISGIVPEEVATIFNDQLSAIAAEQTDTLGFKLLIGLAFALWSAHRGIHALINAITIAYQERESRHFLYLNAFSLLMTIGAVCMVVLALFVMLALPAVLFYFPIAGWQSLLTTALSWIAFFITVITALGLLYRFAPPRRSAKWRWLSPGAVVATSLWLVSSFAFSQYVSQFGSYNETYGALGAIIVLLLWFFLSSFSIVLGALVNSQMELQTYADTTIGKNRPMGSRGAYVADTPPPE